MAEPWQPLAGVRVVDFSPFAPGPFAAAILAELGAEVLEVGPPRRSFAGTPNKRSLLLDLERGESKEVVARLAAGADIVIEGCRPGEAERLGIDYATLARSNARLIHCAVAGCGAGGSRAAIALLAALAQRARSGRGARLELAQLETRLRGALPAGGPRPGEHSREVLVELGFDDAEIAQLMRSGAVKVN